MHKKARTYSIRPFSYSKAHYRSLWERHGDFRDSGSERHMETGQTPKELPRGVQQNGERITAKVINEFLRSFSTWTDFSDATHVHCVCVYRCILPLFPLLVLYICMLHTL